MIPTTDQPGIDIRQSFLDEGGKNVRSVSLSAIVDPGQLERLRRELAEVPHGLERALARALNKVATAVRTQVVRGVSAEIPITQRELKERNVFLHKAHGDSDRLRAAVVITGRRIPISRLLARRAAGGATYARRRGQRTFLPHVFEATMPTGHEGWFGRGPQTRRALRSAKRRGRWIGSFPIVERRGPSVPVLVEGIGELAGELLEERLAQRLADELDTQAALVLEGHLNKMAPSGTGGEE